MEQADAIQDNGYTVIHAAFLQAVMINRTVTLAKATDILSEIAVAYGNDLNDDGYEVHSMVKAINENLYINDLEMKLQRSLDQRTGDECWTFINTNGDEISKYATLLSPDEIEGFRKIMWKIFFNVGKARSEHKIDAERYGIEYSEAKKLCGGTRSGETVLDQLVSTGWLHKSERYISLSERTIVELKDYLIREFGPQNPEMEPNNASDSISTCAGCKEILTFGQRCSNPQGNCKFRLHYHCAIPFFRTLTNSNICPECGITHGGSFTPVGC